MEWNNNKHQHTISERFWGGNRDDASPNFLFYDGKENLLKDLHYDNGVGAREISEDIPTGNYNPGSVVSVFYSGFQL